MPISVIVQESFYTVSGRVFVALQLSRERLAVGATVLSVDGKRWTILDNQVNVGAKLRDILAQKAEEGIFLYELSPIDHPEKPEVGQALTLL